MKVLVSGANGFIGSNLCRKLVEQGHEVRGLILPGTDVSFLAGLPVEQVSGNVTKPETLAAAVARRDWVFHLAAAVLDFGPREWFEAVTLQGSRNMLEASLRAGVKRFVLMSSLAVHGFGSFVEADEATPRACAADFHYGRSKIAAEDAALEYHQRGLPITIIRPGVFPFGPNDVTSFFKVGRALESRTFGYVNGGSALLGTAYVENLVEGMIRAAETPQAAGETFILGDDVKLSWRTLTEHFCLALKTPPPFLSLPRAVALAAAKGLEGVWKAARLTGAPPLTAYRIRLASSNFHFSNRKAREVLQWAPRVGLEEGIERTVAWYRNFQ